MPCFKFKFYKIPISHLEAETPFGLVSYSNRVNASAKIPTALICSTGPWEVGVRNIHCFVAQTTDSRWLNPKFFATQFRIQMFYYFFYHKKTRPDLSRVRIITL